MNDGQTHRSNSGVSPHVPISFHKCSAYESAQVRKTEVSWDPAEWARYTWVPRRRIVVTGDHVLWSSGPNCRPPHPGQSGLGSLVYGRGQQMAAQHACPGCLGGLTCIDTVAQSGLVQGVGQRGGKNRGELVKSHGRDIARVVQRAQQFVADARGIVSLKGCRAMKVASITRSRAGEEGLVCSRTASSMPAPAVFDDRRGNCLLGAEMVVGSALADPGALQNCGESCLAAAPFIEQVDGGVQDPAPSALAQPLPAQPTPRERR